MCVCVCAQGLGSAEGKGKEQVKGGACRVPPPPGSALPAIPCRSGNGKQWGEASGRGLHRPGGGVWGGGRPKGSPKDLSLVTLALVPLPQPGRSGGRCFGGCPRSVFVGGTLSFGGEEEDCGLRAVIGVGAADSVPL